MPHTFHKSLNHRIRNLYSCHQHLLKIGNVDPEFSLLVVKLTTLGGDHLILRGEAWHFLEINILTLKALEINNLSSSGKKINNMTLTCENWGENAKFFQIFSDGFARDSSIDFFPVRFSRIKL